MGTKIEDIVTPVGVLKYPNLNEPRDFEGDGKFKYDTKFILRGADAESLKAKVNEVAQEHLGKNAEDVQHTPWKDVETEDDAFTEFSFKVNAKGSSRTGKEYSRQPIFLQADGTPFEMEAPNIGSGTKARVSITPYCYPKKKGGPLVGISLQPRAVKIIELVERVQKDAKYFQGAFAAEEGATGAADGAGAPASAADY